jgi:periplasmic divalent cation tolerance protein
LLFISIFPLVILTPLSILSPQFIRIKLKLQNLKMALYYKQKFVGGWMKTNFIYITAGSRDEAAKIAKELVTTRLAACVNLLDNMNSFYLWQGEIQEDTEVVMIAKTTEDRIPELVEKVKSMHSYDCPCIVSLPVLGGYQPFIDWIAEEVRDESTI